MSALIARVRALCNGDTALTDDDIQVLLDDVAYPVDAPLIPMEPFATRLIGPYPNLEAGAVVYVAGTSTPLVEGTDYTIDLQRGMVTTPVARRDALRIQGTAYDVFAAAAAGWDRIAARYTLEFDFTSVEGSYSRSQQLALCQRMAAQYRARAWPHTITVDRDDALGSTDVLPHQAWFAEWR
jgi:hypothetical protein